MLWGEVNTPGSSPPAWGTQYRNVENLEISRFIPTRMGNTWGQRMNGTPMTVHPHARGEHDMISLGTGPSPGSSPPAWGTHWVEFIEDRCVRFIPPAWGTPVYQME